MHVPAKRERERMIEREIKEERLGCRQEMERWTDGETKRQSEPGRKARRESRAEPGVVDR